MNHRIVYELNESDLKKVITEELRGLKKEALLSRFEGRLISADCAAEIHGVHRDTIIRYAQAGLIEHQKIGRLWKFQLSYILDINMHDLKKKNYIKSNF